MQNLQDPASEDGINTVTPNIAPSKKPLFAQKSGLVVKNIAGQKASLFPSGSKPPGGAALFKKGPGMMNLGKKKF